MQRTPERSRVVPRAARDIARVARLAPLALAALVVAGCITAPAVVIVDRRTALEQQASGSFRGLEEELEQAGLAPRPAPLTPAQLGASGVRREGLEAADADDETSDAVRSDALLIKRCLGEALDGTLVLTLDPCTGTLDVPSVDRLVERVNRNRRQLWRWLAAQTRRQQREKTHETTDGKTDEKTGEKTGEKADDDVRAAWRQVHLAGLVCGGQYQVAGGAWEVKKC